MEENQTTMLPEQQEPVADGVQNTEETSAAAVETECEASGTAVDETATEEAEVADAIQNIAEEAAESNTDEEQKEEAPQIAVKNAEELHTLSDEELSAYLHSLILADSARQVLKAVTDVKNEVEMRVSAVVEKEKAAQAQGAEPAEAPAEGGDEAEARTETATETEFVHTPSEWETAMAELLKLFDAALGREREEIRKQQEENVRLKQALIDRMTEIVENTKENPSSKLHAVKDICTEWKSIGHLPAEKKDLNGKFHVLTETFFNSLKMDRELRDLDMRRNLAEKTKLCEEAEALKDEANISKAFAQIQRLHANWKAIGRVPRDKSDEIWERFREATAVINKRMHKKAEADHEKEKANYEAKLKLCEEVEALAAKECTSAKEMDQLTQKIQEIQKTWRTIGFAPKDVNDEIYARFRGVCDTVFNAKRDFFKEQNSKLAANLRKKEELCEKAEAVMNSTEWKKTANYLIELQKQWKEVGAVSYKQSDAIWKRFRKACDTFFDNRQSQQDGNQAEMNENLNKKEAIIEELKNFSAPDDAELYLSRLQQIMNSWSTIGFVPLKDKQRVNKEFSDLVSKHFDALNLDKDDSELQRYRGKMQAVGASDKDRIAKERNKLLAQLRQAEQDVETLENNIGFFAKSKSSDGIVADVQHKIAKAKADIESLNKKLTVLDEID